MAFLLILAMMTATFIACDSSSEKSTEAQSEAESVTSSSSESAASEAISETKTETETEKEAVPSIEKKNYGQDFFLSIQPDSNYMEYHWVEESENDALSQSIYNRQQQVFAHLGVEIVGTKVGTSKSYIEPFKIAVKNKDGSVDSVLTHHYHGIDSFISGNYVADFNDYTQISLSSDY